MHAQDRMICGLGAYEKSYSRRKSDSLRLADIQTDSSSSFSGMYTGVLMVTVVPIPLLLQSWTP
jgi:hypothetical protein